MLNTFTTMVASIHPLVLLVIIAGALLLICSLTLLSWRQIRDLRALHYFVRQLIRNKALAIPLRWRLKSSAKIAQGIIALTHQQRLQGDKEKTITEVIQLSSRVSENLANVQEVAEEALNLICRQIGENIVAVALIEKTAGDNRASIKKMCGQGTTALAEALALSFDSVFTHDSTTAAWLGYQSARAHFDFSTFGIGLSYNIEIANQQRPTILWVGLKTKCCGLTHEQKDFIQGIVKHAAGLLGAAQKIYEEKKHTETEKHFLIGLSHDLRSPGATAMLALHSLLEAPAAQHLNSEQIKLLQIINSSLEDQAELINNILDYTKHQHGLLFARMSKFSIAPVLSSIRESVGVSSLPPQLAVSFPRDSNYLVEFDPFHFKRIILNLISNALKYTDQGSITVSCTDLGSQLEISVSDTGIGIPPAEANRLFNNINRLSNVGSRSGSGLGLTICQILASLNNAKMFYRPTIGGGSTFGLRLRVIPDQILEPPRERRRPERALLLEDDELVLTTVKRYLTDYGLTVVGAATVDEALAVYRTQSFDIVISDFSLRHGNAAKLLKLACAKTPLLIATGASDLAELDEYRKNAQVQIVQKPLVRAELYSLLDNLLAASR